MAWNRLTLLERIHWLRLVLPPVLALWVVTYQLAFAQPLEAAYGHAVHYGVEIAFYSLAGPVVTWLTLSWVERNMREKEHLEEQVKRAAHRKAALLAEERERIARDLHDGVAQTLYFLALKADMLRGQVPVGSAAAGELREMGRTARGVIREVRRTIFALRPLEWQEGEFLAALHRFVAGFAEQAGWQITDAIDDSLAIPAPLEPLLFRLIQESLNNVAKHAEAEHVHISLVPGAERRQVLLIVRDDGVGFDRSNNNGSGLGLKQMAARAVAAGGTFQIDSRQDHGTSVVVCLPLPEEDHV